MNTIESWIDDEDWEDERDPDWDGEWEDEDEWEWECAFGDDCVNPHYFHQRADCYTADMAQSYQDDSG